MTTTANIPALSDIQAAANKLDAFLAQPQVQSHASTAEYTYLQSLQAKATALTTNYNDPIFIAANTDTYNSIISDIDQAIRSCRYVFGIVYAETKNSTRDHHSSQRSHRRRRHLG